MAKKVKITKIAANPESFVKQAKTVAEYRNEQDKLATGQGYEEKSPPIEYFIQGIPSSSLEIGKTFLVARTSRNGVPKPGVFLTSPIVEIYKKDSLTFFTTKNSVYRMEDCS